MSRCSKAPPEESVKLLSNGDEVPHRWRQIVLLASKPVLGAPAEWQDPRQERAKQHNPNRHRLRIQELISVILWLYIHAIMNLAKHSLPPQPKGGPEDPCRQSAKQDKPVPQAVHSRLNPIYHAVLLPAT